MPSTIVFFQLSLVALSIRDSFSTHGGFLRKPTSGRIVNIEDFGAISDEDAFDQTSLWTFHDLEDGPFTDENDGILLDPYLSQITEVSLNNTIAFNEALHAAQPGDVVLVPDGKSYTMTGGILAIEKHNITIDFAGSTHFAYDLSAWPFNHVPQAIGYPTRNGYDPGFTIYNSTFIHVTSSSDTRARVKVNYDKNMVYLVDSKTYRGGILNGNGKRWWDDAINGRLPYHGDSRPKLIHVMESENILVEKLTLLNSPYWTITVEAMKAEVSQVNVLVDRKYQASLLGQDDDDDDDVSAMARKLDQDEIDISIPFPIDDLPDWVGRRLRQPEDLNTDGIDPSGEDIWIHDCIVQNADDSVAVKPRRNLQDARTRLPPCTNNVTIENMVLTGFGASVGSVPPMPNHNCIDNVVFRNISMPGTGKGIYIKSDGSDCNGVSGQITNILYENVHMNSPFWWPIWIGPQQQHEPNVKLGLKCPLTYPLPGSRHCPTQGCVTFENITLRNIYIHDPVVSPGVILGNATNPMANITIENLHVHISKAKPWHGKWPFHEKSYPWRGRIKCSSASGVCKNCDPSPQCLFKV